MRPETIEIHFKVGSVVHCPMVYVEALNKYNYDEENEIFRAASIVIDVEAEFLNDEGEEYPGPIVERLSLTDSIRKIVVNEGDKTYQIGLLDDEEAVNYHQADLTVNDEGQELVRILLDVD